MFAVKNPNPIDDSSSDGGESTLGSLPPSSILSAQPQSLHTSLGRLRSQSETNTVHFHRPRPAISRMDSGRHASSGDVGLSPHGEIEDPVIQYEARAWGGINNSREVHVSREMNPSRGSNRERDRRFVVERLPAPRQRDFLDSNSDNSDE